MLFYDDVMVLKKNGSISSSNDASQSICMINLFCELYRLLAVSVDRMLIFIVSHSTENIILKLFHFQFMDLTIEKWSPLKLGMLSNMEWK